MTRDIVLQMAESSEVPSNVVPTPTEVPTPRPVEQKSEVSPAQPASVPTATTEPAKRSLLSKLTFGKLGK